MPASALSKLKAKVKPQRPPCERCGLHHRTVSDDDVGVMVLKEKHGTIYLDATTPNKRRAAALSVLRGRLKEGYWYYEPEEEPKPSLGREQAAALPDGSVKAAAVLEWSVYDGNVASNEEATLFLTNARVAVARKCGDLALWLLRQRDDCEYENFQIESLGDSYD